MNSNIETEMRALLYNFWITKDNNKELYYQIKNKQSMIKDFVSKNLGSNLIIHDRFIKLEKIPTIIKANSGLSNFTSILEYVILSIMLLFLEDKTRGDYFVLSNLIEYVKNTAVALELNHIPDWNKVQDRRCLSNVIAFLEELQIIKIKDYSKISFIESRDAEVLYESLGISNYLMRMFDDNINDLKEPDDFIKNEFAIQNMEKGDIRRYKVFRNILYTPAVFSQDLSTSELDYIKKNRNYIKSEIDRNLNMEVEITHNMALLCDSEDSNEKDNFPNNKKLTEIVLMINDRLLQEINSGNIIVNQYEVAIIKEDYFVGIIMDIKKSKSSYIGKTMMRENDRRFYDMVLEYMEKYNIVEKHNDEIMIYPTVARIIGKTKNIESDRVEQISLFGGSDEL